MIEEINAEGQPILFNHDPGRPLGRVVAARAFLSPTNVRFVASVFAFYDEQHRRTFVDIGSDVTNLGTLPSEPGPLRRDSRIVVAFDPRQVESSWIKKSLQDVPLATEQVRASYNSADALHELIIVAVPYAVLVWNPLVKTVAQEAAKDIYAGIHGWLHRLWTNLKNLRAPILELQSTYQGCHVSFLIRGNDPGRNYAAHDALAAAAVQAEQIVDKLSKEGRCPQSLVYEFDASSSRWYPAHLIMSDGGLISDRAFLIALEKLPTGVSLGFLKESQE